MDNLQELYCDEVMKFRKVLNLTSVKDKHTFHHTFIKPSVYLARWIPDKAVVLDIGSGMGIPGIPLMIHRPDIQGILVERRMKRAEFIRHVIRKLKLHGVVYDADIKDLPPLGATVCTARAVSKVSVLIDLCNKHMIDGGLAIFPVPHDATLPKLEGWVLQDDVSQQNQQRIVCYRKANTKNGGVSRET